MIFEGRRVFKTCESAGLERSNRQAEPSDSHSERVDVDAVYRVQRCLHSLALIEAGRAACASGQATAGNRQAGSDPIRKWGRSS